MEILALKANAGNQDETEKEALQDQVVLKESLEYKDCLDFTEKREREAIREHLDPKALLVQTECLVMTALQVPQESQERWVPEASLVPEVSQGCLGLQAFLELKDRREPKGMRVQLGPLGQQEYLAIKVPLAHQDQWDH